MKLRFLLLMVLFTTLSWGQSVIISQYIETDSGTQPKGIEIFNVSGSDIVFSAGNNLEVYQGTNGGSCSSLVNITSGTLKADEVWVVGTSTLTSSATSNGTALSGTTTYGFSFNGDDALQIRLGGVIEDVFGICGSDPGSAWSGGGVSTANYNLQVLDGLCSGDTDGWTDPSERFTQIANGSTMTGFGNAPASCSTNTPTITVSPTALTGFTYLVGSGPSAEQTFTASGSNLTGYITITAPTNYEISLTSGGPFSSSLTLIHVLGNVANTTIYVRLKAGLSVGNYNGETITLTSSGATTQNVTCDGNVTGSANSDIITAGGEATTVSSIENDATITTTADGVQVWQFTIRDGGGSADGDNLPTIVNSIIFSQNAGNQVNNWDDAIQAIALFNGSTKIADGVVTTNTITFTGAPLISVPDNGTATLSVRLSIQTSPNDSGNNTDGDDFVFNISNANVTAGTSGSQFTSFSVATSTNGLNVLDVIATQLVFTQQPSTTGIGATMSPVLVSATDANGNIDSNYSGTVSITSTGTMTGAPLTATASSGVANFNTIIHTVAGTGFTLTATASGLTLATSTTFDIANVTTLQPGDLAILAVNTAAEATGSADEISFVCFQDLLPGTTIYLTDNGYERLYPGLWGDTEGIISLNRINTTLPKGTIITIHTTNGGVNDSSDFTVYTCGSVDSNWTKGVASSSSFFFDLNKDDQVWITQGGTWNDPNPTAGEHNVSYTGGNVLYGWTDIDWKTAPGYSSTKGSTIFPQRECFTTNVENPESGYSQVKFNDPTDPDFSTTTRTRLDWIALINNPSNWDYYTNYTDYYTNGFDYYGSTTCPAMTIVTGGGQAGLWTGRVDTNWFNCGNWDTLVVPDETVDVQVPDNIFNNQATVDITAPFANYYSYVAKAKNITITGEKVEIVGNPSNILEIHGDLLIDSPAGALDMDDSNAATADGTIHLYGNWTNNLGETAFQEGNGTVHFDGITPQIISNVTPIGTEMFYDVVMNNNFTTSISNNLIATGDLTVTTGNTITVNANNYVQVNNDLTVNGTFTVDNNGSLIQVEDTGVNTGNITYNRTTTCSPLDYVYWSSPVNGVNTPSSGHIYYWNPTYANPNNGWGYWLIAHNTPMDAGVGYIMRNIPSRVFTGVPRNGIIQPTISRANYTSIDFSGANGVTITNKDDNWNLVGNPYPSSIRVSDFLTENTNIEGAVRIWTHGTAPSTGISDPVYDSFVYNYTVDDYIVYNGTGTDSGPLGFNGYIAGGQGFMINMNDGPATAETITFNNSMRSRDYDNSQFYRQANKNTTATIEEKHRIWLDLVDSNNNATRTLIGYVTGATYGKDRVYDAVTNALANSNRISTLINDERMLIQGRALPFDDNDEVPIQIFAAANGTYSIAISAIDGIFDLGQDVYLHDLQNQVYHDLKANPYSFYTTAGEISDRFVLVYKDATLTTNSNNLIENQVLVSTSNTITINSINEDLDNIEIYNLLGQSLLKKTNLSSNQIIIDSLRKLNQVLIVTIKLGNGNTLSKRIIF